MTISDRKIYSKGLIPNSSKGRVQKVKYNREQLLSKKTAEELNTYLNFGVFPTFSDTALNEYDENGNLTKKAESVGTPGVRSIFNRAGAVLLGSSDGSYAIDVSQGDSNNTHDWRIGNNVPLMDSPKARQRIRQSSGCSVKELVEASSAGLMGQETYAYSDFMYCKHLGKVSNNYMITLRRFPLPVADYIGASGITTEQRIGSSAKNAASIGCMVTWMGVSGNEMSNILKYSFKMPFKEETAEFQNASEKSADSSNGILNGVAAMFDSTYRKQYMEGKAGTAANRAFEYLGIKNLGEPPYQSYAQQRDEKTKVWGPIDSIRSTYVRADTGLDFKQSITLVFEYELRSYNGINAKQAMLDLISNILNVTYTTGTFWGGGFKGFGAHQNSIFENLNVFKANGGFTDFIDKLSQDIDDVSDKFKSSLQGKTAGDILKNALNQVGGMLLSGVLNKLGRPQKAMYNALLSPAPIGFWHVTIGNPKKPIMSIGNMIITNVTMEHSGPLGLDDFPTGLKVTVELDRGKPRDLRDIEKLYMQGNDRIYSPMGDKVFDMYKNAELYRNSKSPRGIPRDYNPVSNIATIKTDPNTREKTVSIEKYKDTVQKMKKYFGTNDTYAIYVPAAEQEYGAGKKKKPSTEANKDLKGG